jgi:hypothetical protein
MNRAGADLVLWGPTSHSDPKLLHPRNVDLIPEPVTLDEKAGTKSQFTTKQNEATQCHIMISWEGQRKSNY